MHSGGNVMYFNDGFCYHRRDKQLFLKDKYTKKELEILYNDVYLYNLKQILLSGYSTYSWRDIDEYDEIYGTLVDDFTNSDHNSFLKNMADRTLIGKEIMDIGLYAPIFASERALHKRLVVDGGKHRITSAKILSSIGEWDNRKILTIETKEVNVVRLKDAQKEWQEKLKEPLIMRMPMSLFFSAEYETYDPSFVDEKLGSINGKRLENDIVEFPLDDLPYCYRCLLLTGYWITEMFYAYRTMTGKNIKPSPVINDQKAFELWLKK
jgi:hypothetical protein